MPEFTITDKHFELQDKFRAFFKESDGYEVHLVIDGNFTDPKFQQMCIHIYDSNFKYNWVVLFDLDNRMFFDTGHGVQEILEPKDLWLIMYMQASQEIQ